MAEGFQILRVGPIRQKSREGGGRGCSIVVVAVVIMVAP